MTLITYMDTPVWKVWCTTWVSEDDAPSTVRAWGAREAVQAWIDGLDSEGQSDAADGVELLLVGDDERKRRCFVGGEFIIDWHINVLPWEPGSPWRST